VKCLFDDEAGESCVHNIFGNCTGFCAREVKGKSVLLIDGDNSGFPNLALMKISTFYKKQGWQVYLNEAHTTVDKIYASCVFTWNKKKTIARLQSIQAMFPDIEIEKGGYAFSPVTLPLEVDTIMPDYSLYDVDYSVGFTSRGCIRACPFCIVSKNEGTIRPVMDIYKFWNPKHKKMVLLDNNLLASPECSNVLQSLIKEKIKVDFNQGLDIRLVNDENAKLLAKVKAEVLRFSLDSPHVEKDFIKGVETLKRNGMAITKLVVYVLIGYNTTFEQDMERFKILTGFGMAAFPMIFRDYEGNYKVRPTGNTDEIIKKCRMPIGMKLKLMKFYGILKEDKNEDIYAVDVKPFF